jgi:RHS repeat-associated protein
LRYLPGSAGYTYDAAGNRTSKTAVQQASPSPVSVTSAYSYDNIHELTQAVVGGTLAESYSYETVGNRLASAGPTSYNYNASNELTSSSAATYTYDNNGNTLTKTDSTGTTDYTWDFENRLASVTLPGTGGTVNFRYDPFGRRIEKVSPTVTTVYAYDGDNVVAELDGGGNLLAHYTQGAGIDEPLAMYQGLTTSYFHADGLGSITSLTDSTGNVAVSYVYDSFGNLTASTGKITNPFQYTGREFDSETGLYYYRARYYDPTSGRFTSEDPSGPTQGPNLYSYVYNSPIGSVDPSGLYTIDKSCQGRCLSLGGGGPNNPNQPPHQVSLEELIRQGTDDACSKLYTITDLKLRSCIQKSCNQGKIKCDCGSNEGGFNFKIPLLTNRTAHVCFKDWPNWTDPSYAASWYGQTAIHEWAHGCGWNHGDGRGVPNDPGRGR